MIAATARMQFARRAILVVPSIFAMIGVGNTARCDDAKQNSKHDTKSPFDCHQQVCSSKMDMLKQSMRATRGKKGDEGGGASTTGSANAAGTASTTANDTTPAPLPTPMTTSNEDDDDDECPLDKDELGHSTWKLLHTLAAYYPEQPTEQDQTSARQLMVGLANLYPCEICRQDFIDSVAARPPRCVVNR